MQKDYNERCKMCDSDAGEDVEHLLVSVGNMRGSVNAGR